MRGDAGTKVSVITKLEVNLKTIIAVEIIGRSIENTIREGKDVTKITKIKGLIESMKLTALRGRKVAIESRGEIVAKDAAEGKVAKGDRSETISKSEGITTEIVKKNKTKSETITKIGSTIGTTAPKRRIETETNTTGTMTKVKSTDAECLFQII